VPNKKNFDALCAKFERENFISAVHKTATHCEANEVKKAPRLRERLFREREKEEIF
jgi:hypothetical protein